jgi:glycosyltransferase involved in cell wall biosynthesis
LKFECLFRADHVICVSESTKKDLTSFYAVDPRKLSVIYHGCSFPVSVPPSDDVCAPFLLYVGLRGSYKNFTRLLEVYAGSASIKRDFKLICFGGPRFSALELHNMKILGVEGRVTRVVGDDKRLQNLYCSAACFIYPSLYEGFGMPVLEAMACGCPVACSSTSSLPEIGGSAAEYFEPSDCDSIRTAIERLVYSDTRRRYMAVQGKHRAAQFSWDRCARQTFQVYSSLMKSVAWPQYPSAISETH